MTGGFGVKLVRLTGKCVCECVSLSISLSAEQRAIPEKRSEQPARLINCRD